MTSRPPRAPPTPAPTPGPQQQQQQQHGPKLPKFFQKGGRDRSKSVVDPVMQAQNDAGVGANIASSSSSSSIAASPPTSEVGSGSTKSQSGRRASRLKGVLKELKDDRIGQNASPAPGASSSSSAHSPRSDELTMDEDAFDEMPVIVEPAPTPRARVRAERPLSASSSDSHPAVSYYPSSHSSSSSQRLSDMSTRLSGWFSHTFSTSSTDLSLPTILQGGPSGAAAAAASSSSSYGASGPSSSPKSRTGGIGLLTAARHGKGHLDKAVRYLLDSDATPDKNTDPIWILGVQHLGYEPPPPPSVSPPPPPPTSSSSSGRRSSMDVRRSSSIRNSVTSIRGAMSSPEPTMAKREREPGAHWPPIFYSDFTSRIWCTYRSHFPPIRDTTLAQLEMEASGQMQPVSQSPRKWAWIPGMEKGWSCDSGWGCMLRTGQSLLANALIHLHLGREWRRPPYPIPTSDYATYVKILTWFFDSPDPRCPFSVHRMALAGKDLGKDVGSWFGPSTAAGAIKTLAAAFPDAGLGVAVANDGVLYETDVLAASNSSPYMFRHSRIATSSPNHRRHRSMQTQSLLSIWGQRPVLVLVGVRLGLDRFNPIYFDAVKELYTFPQSVGIAGGRPSSSYYFVGVQGDNLFYLDPHHTRPTVPYRAPPTTSRASINSSIDSPPSSWRDMNSGPGHMKASSSASSYQSRSSMSPVPSQGSLSGQSSASDMDPLMEYFTYAYTQPELATYHCDKVRKMHISGLDPSMLIGFLCRDERDWRDLRERVTELSRKYKAIFAIQDEPPSWPSDSDEMGMESVSDVDGGDLDIEGPEDAFSLSPEPPEDDDEKEKEISLNDEDEKEAGGRRSRQSEEETTEEDPVDPLTPGPNMTAAQSFEQAQMSKLETEEVDLLGDEEWDDAGLPVETPTPLNPHRLSAVRMSPANSNDSAATSASYVSASSSYSSLMRESESEAKDLAERKERVKSPLSQPQKEQEKPQAQAQLSAPNVEKQESGKGSKTRRSTKARSAGKARGGGGHPPQRPSSSAQEYFPFPVVDDRDPEDADGEGGEHDGDTFQELSSQSESSQQYQRSGNGYGYGNGRGGRDDGSRTRTITMSNRTPVASVIMANREWDRDKVGHAVDASNSSRDRDWEKVREREGGETNVNGVGVGQQNGGSRIRNAVARDGGRTQSGGVRGIVASSTPTSTTATSASIPREAERDLLQ